MPEDKENINEENNDSGNLPEKEKSLFGKIIKWFFILLLITVILVIGVFIFIQTDTFDRIALNYALDAINSSLDVKEGKDSRIYAESLEGNLFSGFRLKNGSVRVKNDTLLKFSSIEAKYNIFALLRKEISVMNLTIKQPQINLTKVKGKNDSLVWNLNHLLSSDKIDEDTTTKEFDWGITAENIQIENGSVRILEEKTTDKPIREINMDNKDTFDISYFDLSELNLRLSAKYYPEMKEADLKKLTFKTNSKFNVDTMSFRAVLNDKDSLATIKNFSLVTDRTDIKIYEVEMNNVKPLKGIEYEKFEKNNMKLNLYTRNFNFDDLKYFLPDLDFLDSSVSLELAAEGKYGNLNIEKLKLITPNSSYTFSGNVKNLDEPENLLFDITGKDIEIDPNDTRLVIPGLDIPDYSYLGKVTIPSITYKGAPDRFTSVLDARSGAGNVTGEVYLDLTQSVPKYKADLTVANLNIGRIIKDKSLESSINGDFVADAAGFDYRTASGRLNYKINRTKIFGQNISSSNGQLSFNRGNVKVDADYKADIVNARINGQVNISNIKNISYDLKGNVTNLNIAGFTKDNSQSSSLNFGFEIKGSGFTPDEMNGNYRIDMNPSTFAGIEIPATPLDITLDRDGMTRKVSVKTAFADLNADGYFDFSSLAGAVSRNIEKLSEEIGMKFFPDTLNTDYTNAADFTSGCSNIFMNYSVDVKNMSPLSSFTGKDTLHLIGNFSGSVSDSCGLFSLLTQGDIKYFIYRDSVFKAKDAKLNLSFRNDITAKNLSGLDINLGMYADKIQTGSFPVDSAIVKVRYFENKNNFSVSARQDSTISFFTGGKIQDSLVIVLDTMNAKYQEFRVRNNKDLVFRYSEADSSGKISFRQFTINSLRQRFNISGDYSFSDSSSIKITADNLKISTYQKLSDPDIDTNNVVSGNIRRMELYYNGTFENPELRLEANSDILEIGGTKIGRLDALINFKDNEFHPDISFNNISNSGSFRLNGNLPFINPLSEEKTDSLERIKIMQGKELNITATAKNFQLKVLQQLLPYTTSLEGILDGKINMTGTPEAPVLAGKMDINRGMFYVTLNRMKYNFKADLSTSNNRLIIQDSKIYTSQEKSRFITTTGYIDFTNLTLNEINLNMSGDLKAFDKKNGQTQLGISGDLWIGSGSPKLKIQGNQNGINLTGNLVLIKGNVVFNPFIQEAYNIYSDDFNYGVIIDSIKSVLEPDGKVLLQRNDSDIVYSKVNLNPFQKVLYVNNNKNLKKKAISQGSSFIYNLYVTTSGNVFLKFIVNEKSQQEFFGEIKTDIYIDNKDKNQISGRGIVKLGNNCYYKFFRKFDATGTAKFNGPVTNPELAISATYKGYADLGTGSSGRQNMQDVIIDLSVTGSAMNPTLSVTLDRGNNKESGSNATSDAISFLLFGRFKDQLSFDQSTSLGANIGASYLSSFVSSSIEDILPWIINTNINYVDSEGGSIASNADIRFTAAIGDAIVRFGGQIFKGIANTDIIVDYPLNKLLRMESLSNNLFIRVEKVYDAFSESTDVSNTTGTRAGATVFYKIKY
ncbi:MAG: translocation/assembly module TamB domain-containing protein [Ignavibacteria bacterium]|nr:translocation/assembly module TamB domain-containing protein [Ignavibacteria bacterium]